MGFDTILIGFYRRFGVCLAIRRPEAFRFSSTLTEHFKTAALSTSVFCRDPSFKLNRKNFSF